MTGANPGVALMIGRVAKPGRVADVPNVAARPTPDVGIPGEVPYDAARAAHLSQAQLIEEMLEERRKAMFWAALEAETPDQEYLDELAEADTAFVGDAAGFIARFEAVIGHLSE